MPSLTPPPAVAHHTGSHLSVNLPYSEPGSPSGHPTTVGFIGLGNIGGSMAKNLAIHTALQKHNAIHLVFWNRTIAKATQLVAEVEESLASHGGVVNMKVADDIEELATNCDVIIMSMPSDQTLLDMVNKLSAIFKQDSTGRTRIIVDTSTIYPKTAGQADTILTADSNVRFVAAPVFGATAVAKAGKLIICLAGDYASKKKVAYLLCPATGRKVIDLGGNVEKALAFKLLGNSFILGTMELVAETQTLAEKVGVGSEAFHSLLTDLMPAPPILGYSERMLNDNFSGNTGFSIEGGLKDCHHMQRLASDYNVPMPVIDIAQQHLLTARALNNAQPSYKKVENLDWSALVAASRVGAGLDPFDSSKHKTGPIPEPEEE